MGLPSYYPWVVKMRVTGLLNLHPAILFGLVRSDSTELAEVLSATRSYFTFVPIRVHSRFETI